jgi:hypothetical protein
MLTTLFVAASLLCHGPPPFHARRVRQRARLPFPAGDGELRPVVLILALNKQDPSRQVREV